MMNPTDPLPFDNSIDYVTPTICCALESFRKLAERQRYKVWCVGFLPHCFTIGVGGALSTESRQLSMSA